MFIMCCCRDVAGVVCLSCAAVEMWQVLCIYHVLLLRCGRCYVFIMCCCRDVAGVVCLSCAAVEMWLLLCVYHVLL